MDDYVYKEFWSVTIPKNEKTTNVIVVDSPLYHIELTMASITIEGTRPRKDIELYVSEVVAGEGSSERTEKQLLGAIDAPRQSQYPLSKIMKRSFQLHQDSDKHIVTIIGTKNYKETPPMVFVEKDGSTGNAYIEEHFFQGPRGRLGRGPKRGGHTEQ